MNEVEFYQMNLYERKEMKIKIRNLEDLLNQSINALWVLSQNSGPAGEVIDRQLYASGALNHIRKRWDELDGMEMRFYCPQCGVKQAVLFGDGLCQKCSGLTLMDYEAN